MKEHKHLYVHCSVIYVGKERELPKCPPIDEWIKQLWDIYTMKYYLAVNKKKILLSVTAWIDLENIGLSEISQSENNKCHMISVLCGI